MTTQQAPTVLDIAAENFRNAVDRAIEAYRSEQTRSALYAFREQTQRALTEVIAEFDKTARGRQSKGLRSKPSRWPNLE